MKIDGIALTATGPVENTKVESGPALPDAVADRIFRLTETDGSHAPGFYVSDGTVWQPLVETSSPYDVAYGVPGNVAAGVLFTLNTVRAFSVTAAKCRANLTTAGSSSSTVSIKKNGAQVGTITFAASSTTGVITLTNGLSLAIGDVLVLDVTAAGTNAAGLSVTLCGQAT